MKKTKKDVANFQQLDAAQMKNINGGKLIEAIINGEKKLIWVPD